MIEVNVPEATAAMPPMAYMSPVLPEAADLACLACLQTPCKTHRIILNKNCMPRQREAPSSLQ